jgi:hypothetical protein
MHCFQSHIIPKRDPIRLRIAVAIALAATMLASACSSGVARIDQDGGTDDADVDASADATPGCCPVDPSPSCCMDYGGWDEGRSCPSLCEGMPLPSDRGWALRTDEHGCEYWSNPNDRYRGGKYNAATQYCGAAPAVDAGEDGATNAVDAGDAG